LWIKKYRIERGLTHGQLAEAVGVTRAAIYKWEDGSVYPSADKLPIIADCLGVTIDALFGRGDPKAS
jgi:transcriptional regulator with XRE-family HTH domain